MSLSLQEKSGRDLQDQALNLISEYLGSVKPDIQDANIRLFVTPERYGK